MSLEGLVRSRSIVLGLLVGLVGCASSVKLAKVSEGQPMPELPLTDLAGKPVSLSSFRGRVVLLDFWATWCEPCKDSLPVYDGFVRELGERGLVVLAVSEDEDRSLAGPFLGSHAPRVTGLHDPGGRTAEQLSLPAMPTAFVIDRAGSVALVHAGFRESEAAGIRARLESALGP
ncbi:MAG: TlpA family protein disulfide reductase [Deltaproteobacteria bacterium]|nr:TlpA family protein disulfide reductase [Deltaproteobacteria bacterium]